jgi:hypothetical protein
LELEEGKEDTFGDIIPNVEISLQALTSHGPANSKMLQVTVGAVQLRALLDTSSMHIFIDSKVAGCLGLPVTLCADLSVMVANGDRVSSLCVCLTTGFTIHDEHFAIDCFTLNHSGFDLVVGIHWLRTLGPHHLGLCCPLDGLLVQRPLTSLEWYGQPVRGCLCHR